MKKSIKTRTVYRFEATPRGRQLFTYFLAAMSTLGGFSPSRKAMDRDSLSRFFATDTAIKYHTRQGNLEMTKKGVRLTVQGWNYFSGRLAGRIPGQKVEKIDLEAMKYLIQHGKPAKESPDWIAKAKVRPIEVRIL